MPTTLILGQEVKIAWSNGAGYALYRVDESNVGLHTLVLVAEFAVCADGSFVRKGGA